MKLPDRALGKRRNTTASASPCSKDKKKSFKLPAWALEKRKHRRLLERLSGKLAKKLEKKKALEKSIVTTPVVGKYGVVLDEAHHDPAKQLDLKKLVTRIVALAQTLAEKRFYDYQIEIAYRIIESVLLHDGDVITALIARQSGKTETLSSVVAALGIILPQLAAQYKDDWRLNITDEKGVYRGFRNGIQIGIYAPRREQAEIMFNRIKHAFESDTGIKILKELNLKMSESNGDRIRLSNGTRILSQSASEQSKIEGATHHLLIAEEAQDISDLKVRKSLHPMVSSLLGTMVKIGTATTRKCDFYNAIKTNERTEIISGKRNNFFYPHTITERYNSLYRKYVEKERQRLGEDSDEFRMAYGCEWIFERGMFITQAQLFHTDVVQSYGMFSLLHPRGLHKNFAQYKIIVGIDWGSSSDSTVLTVMAVNWNAPLESGVYEDMDSQHDYTFYKKHVLNWVEFIGDNYESQYWQIFEYLKSLPNLAKIVTDSNTCGLPIFDRLKASFDGSGVEVVPFNFNQRIKSDAYKSLYSEFCGHRITFPAHVDVRKTTVWRKFVNQMLDLRKDYNKGLMSVSHPDERGAHDDYPDSLTMASWGANTPSGHGGIEMLSGNLFYTR